MSEITHKELLDAGVHFGHLTRKWNPRMAPYILMEHNGIHLLDLKKTTSRLKDAKKIISGMAKSGRKILFVATKKQAQDIVLETAEKHNMPYVTQRWLGGMLTNFSTVKRSVKKMQNIEKMAIDGEGAFKGLAKRERLQLVRRKDKMYKVLGGIEYMNRLPAALFVIDTEKEHIAIAEAKKLNIPVFAIVDTNSDPTHIDYPIPGNDDSAKSIQILVSEVSKAIAEGLQERSKQQEIDAKDAEIKESAKAEAAAE